MAKKSIAITLYMSEIIYEVQNKTFLTGRSRFTGENHEAVAHMQANDDEENKNQVLRSIGNAYASLKSALGEYLSDAGTMKTNKQIADGENLEVKLSVPSNFNEAVIDAVTAGINQYIVDSSIADWFIITNKADAQEYLTAAGADIAQIREAINQRVRPVRTGV